MKSNDVNWWSQFWNCESCLIHVGKWQLIMSGISGTESSLVCRARSWNSNVIPSWSAIFSTPVFVLFAPGGDLKSKVTALRQRIGSCQLSTVRIPSGFSRATASIEIDKELRTGQKLPPSSCHFLLEKERFNKHSISTECIPLCQWTAPPYSNCCRVFESIRAVHPILTCQTDDKSKFSNVSSKEEETASINQHFRSTLLILESHATQVWCRRVQGLGKLLPSEGQLS